MHILRFLVMKMWSRKGATLVSLISLLIAVALTTSIPMYTNGSIKNLIYKQLQDYSAKGLPAGSLVLRYQTIANQFPTKEQVAKIDRYTQEEVAKRTGLPLERLIPAYQLKIQPVELIQTEQDETNRKRQLGILSLSDPKEEIQIVEGKLFSDKVENGVIEALLPRESLAIHRLKVGDTISYPVTGGKGIPPLKVKVVGSYEVKDEASPYWYLGRDLLRNMLLIHENVMKQQLIERGVPLSVANWLYLFDLNDITSSQISHARSQLANLDIELNKILPNTKTEISFYDLLDQFARESNQLRLMLFTLAAPILVLLFYFIVMNARQGLERQRGDIVVLRSRGASRRQIVLLYFLESAIIGGLSFILGPILGYWMAKVLGSSNGFLSFVNRKAVMVEFTPDILGYALLAIFAAILANTLPALGFSKQSVVNYKQELAVVGKRPFWEKFFVDLLLLGIAAYGWYLFMQRKITLLSTGLSPDQLQVDPLLFFIPAIFLFGAGFLFLRLFPLLLRLIFVATKRWLNLPFYLTITQLSRSAKQYHPVMLLLTLTLGLGVYSASSARTIDQNETDRFLYKNGTDVVMEAQWEKQIDPNEMVPTLPQNPGGSPGGMPGVPGGGSGTPGGGGGGSSPPVEIPFRYVEPPFEAFKNLEGAKGVTRVLTKEVNVSVGGKSLGQGKMMAIDNADFAKAAYFKDSLYAPYHPYQYLRLLGEHEAALIASSSFMKKYDLKPGTILTMVIKSQPVDFILYAGAPYWPTLYPDEEPFFIVNLAYLQDQLPIEPYQVWIKMAPGGSLAQMMNRLADQGIYLLNVYDYRSELIRQLKHPSRGGVFGVLSLGFLVSVLISLLGYLLYWFYSLSSRSVQFGILRATGLKRGELLTMLLLEQIFTAGTSILMGFIAGGVASRLFIPFMQVSGTNQTQVPPFEVIFRQSDLAGLGVMVLVMLIIGAAFLTYRIRALRIHQAVKLGEER